MLYDTWSIYIAKSIGTLVFPLFEGNYIHPEGDRTGTLYPNKHTLNNTNILVRKYALRTLDRLRHYGSRAGRVDILLSIVWVWVLGILYSVAVNLWRKCVVGGWGVGLYRAWWSIERHALKSLIESVYVLITSSYRSFQSSTCLRNTRYMLSF